MAKRSWIPRRSAGSRSRSSTSPRSEWRGRSDPVAGSGTRMPAVTAARIGSRTVASSRSDTAATSRSSTGRPATATTPRSRWLSSGSEAIWPARVSESVRGSGPVPPRRSTPTSSSTKNGFPPERAWIRSTCASSATDPRIVATWRPTSARSSRSRSSRLVRGSRSSAASQVETGSPWASPSVRTVSTSSRRSRSRLRARKVTRSRVPRSTQCRSSKTRTVGVSAPRSPSRPRTSPNRLAWARPDRASEASPRVPSAAGAIGPMPGSKRPISSRAGPSTDAIRSGGRSRRKARNASVNGAYGRPSSARSRQPPTSTRMPSPRARTANSSMSRVLPIPASPATTTIPGSPSAARASAARRAPSSGSRPTSSGLETRLAIARVYARPVRMRYPSRLD